VAKVAVVLEDRRDGLTGYRFEALDRGAVNAFVTTRGGGLSSGPYRSLNLGLRVGDDPEVVLENRRRAFQAFEVDLERSVWCRQIHSDGVVIVDEADAGRGALTEDDVVPDADALVTHVPELPLCVTLADCVPVVIHDAQRSVLGLAHAGWGGTVSRIASRTVEAMKERFGSDPGDLAVGIGPSIGPRRYEVGQEVVERASEAFGSRVADLVSPLPDPGKALFDLWSANRIDLESVGVLASRIEIAEISTDERLDEFYSHRTEGTTGRFIAAASLRPRR
jgi:purine-nucleoside/S-methyl-5'-thioadenosine phosphorylase / adenosine deaminase